MMPYMALAGYYDELTDDVSYGSFADFYEQLFSLYGLRPESVIDLACGTGSMTLELAGRGYDMIAVDRSPEMLSQAAEKLGGFSPAPLLVCQPLEELDLYGTSDAAVCTLDGMNYITRDSLAAVFRRIRLFLNPGGILVFDCLSEQALREMDGQISLDEKDDVFCVWRSEYDGAERSCSYYMDIFERSGSVWRRDSEEHTEYAHSEDELRAALSAGGFSEIRFFADRRMEEPGGGDRRFFCAARKPIGTEHLENG
ncbi:MAG: class I SAM-dependent methyltransferase [Oscillospiraceae bacterium]|nr:class I SAM-dependent methyltransferase [Oscillospiraceae bacterium]